MTKPDFIKGHQMFVNGKAVWAKVTNATGPNDMSQKFQLDLELDEASLAEIQSFGPRVFEAVVKTTRKAKDSDARVECTPFITPKSNNLPRVFGANRLPYDGPIGNGSDVRCQIIIKVFEYKGKKGLTVYLNAVVVVNLVEYSNINEDALFDGLTAGTDDVFGEAPKPNVDEWSPNIGSTTKATSAAQIIKDKNAEKPIISDDDLPF
jgi:hypothetical protein